MNADTAELKALRAEVAELAGLIRSVAEAVGELARRQRFDDAIIEVERERAVAEDRAARPAARRRRGHLHPAAEPRPGGPAPA